MTFQEQVNRDAAINATAYEFISVTEAMKITAGIIFVYARWSGTAIQSWRTLTAILATFDFRPRILVVDADELEPTSAMELFEELPQGKGETLWIKNGKTVARLASYRETDTEMLIKHTKSLFN